MKGKHVFLLSTLGVASLSLATLVIVGSHNAHLKASYASDTETVLDADELAKCTLNPYTFDGQTSSRQFVYNLANGKYIQGAVLYGDCQHQSVGATLADTMTMDNNGGADYSNAADFHFFFCARGLNYVEFTFDMWITNAAEGSYSDEVRYGAKISNLCGTDLYDALEDRSYNGLGGVVKDINATDFYVAGGNARDNVYLTQSKPESRDLTFSYTPIDTELAKGPLNAVAFFVNPYWIRNNATFNLTLKSVVLHYTCETNAD